MNHNINVEKFDLLLSPVPEVDESRMFSPQNAQTSCFSLKFPEGTKSRDCGKKNSLTAGYGSVYLNKIAGTPIKRKPFPVCVHSNSSAEAVLRERKVEIKDLECEVSYLKKRIKEMNIENKTLLDIQSRQEKELKKLKSGVADIPALLRSHKEEIKASEAVVTSLRRELLDCQKDLKTRSDIVVRKDHQLDKLNITIQKFDKQLREIKLQNKQLKEENKKVEQENKKLKGGNGELKSANEVLKKKEQDSTDEMLKVQAKLDIAMHAKYILEREMCKLQKKYETSLQKEIELGKSLEITTETVHTQTDVKELVSKECMALPSNDVLKITDESSLQILKEDVQLLNTNTISKAEGDSWYQKYGLKQDETFGKVKHIFGSTKTSEVYNSCDVSEKAVRSHSLQAIHSKNKFCPDAIKTDYDENRMNRIFSSESDEDCKFSYGSGNRRYISNERQKSKRLFSSFTVPH
ncbi:hypothetical protein JTE90_001953 [Oedothorax gibbosus]|uniref:Lebercilin domain-containing protein n=1 Tax=Oedothorax gibbosus TaxID=931172 RepID=A0AAV6VT60_9ARAC|nr:hypothetical protein JTE90_001953 [Oedothorax gibbosus]